MKQLQGKKKVYGIGILLAVLLILGTVLTGADFEQKNHEMLHDEALHGPDVTIRVGCIGYDGFIKKDAKGVYRGYGVAFLDKVSQYTGWKFEFVEGVWGELLVQLKEGEIDMVCSALKTPEREKEFLFSNRNVGMEESIICARAGDASIYFQDYTALNGRRVGMIKDSAQISLFDYYAREHNITYVPKIYASDVETTRALEKGEVDAVVFESISRHENLKIVDRFGERAFYCMTSGQNEEFMHHLDAAMDAIYADSPKLHEQLMNIYFESSRYNAHPLFTRREAEYIRNLEKPVRIGCLTGLYPMGYVDSKTGELDGIYKALVEKIQKVSGLNIELEPISIRSAPEELIRNGEFDLIAGVVSNQDIISKPEFHLTDSFFSQPFSIVALKGNDVYSKKQPIIAVGKSFERYPSLLAGTPEAEDYIFGDTPEDCLEAVRTGKADMAILSIYVMNPFLQKERYKDLVITTLPGLEIKNSMLISANADRNLLSVINKSIASIGEDTVKGIVGHYTTGNFSKITLKEFAKEYKTQLILVGLLLLNAVIFLIMGRRRWEKVRLERMEKEIYKKRAETDSLTGLYSLAKFTEESETYLERNEEKECRILLINVEKFKLVNELFGIEEGDKFLCFFADVIRIWCVENDSLCTRREADKFVILTSRDWKDIEAAVGNFRRDIRGYSSDFALDICVGVYIVDDKKQDMQIMCGRARMAADSIKETNLRRMAVYDDTDRMRMIRERMIVGEMDEALKTGQFCVYFQPKYNIRTGGIIGSEALVRWLHPTDGLRAPGMFIPVFEKNGFVARLDLYVYEEVCKLLRKWLDAGIKAEPVSVNLSRVGLRNQKLCETLCAIADKYEIPRSLLELEVTETVYANDAEVLSGVLQQLRSEGFRVLMDDFGSGYSSLNMLKEAPIDEIKLDMRFLSAPDPYGRAEKIVGMMIAMGREMSLDILAEGVETENQRKMLERFQCYMAQGYYYSRPVPEAEYEQMLRREQ